MCRKIRNGKRFKDGERFRTEKDPGQRSIQDEEGFRMENIEGFRPEKFSRRRRI